MTNYKTSIIWIVVLLIQGSLSKPVDDKSNESLDEETIRKNPTPEQKILLYVYDNFLGLIKEYVTSAANISNKMLKDESLIANHNSEVEEFKKNLTIFVNKFNAENISQSMWDLVNFYESFMDYYLELPEEKQTTDSRFIVQQVNKYNVRSVLFQLTKNFKVFMEEFMKLFDQNRMHLDKPILDWYDKFKTTTDFEEQIKYFDEFFNLI